MQTMAQQTGALVPIFPMHELLSYMLLALKLLAIIFIMCNLQHMDLSMLALLNIQLLHFAVNDCLLQKFF